MCDSGGDGVVRVPLKCSHAQDDLTPVQHCSGKNVAVLTRYGYSALAETSTEYYVKHQEYAKHRG